MGKVTHISHGRNSHWDNKVYKKKKRQKSTELSPGQARIEPKDTRCDKHSPLIVRVRTLCQLHLRQSNLTFTCFSHVVCRFHPNFLFFFFAEQKTTVLLFFCLFGVGFFGTLINEKRISLSKDSIGSGQETRSSSLLVLQLSPS